MSALEGLCAVVTGASSGIGEATARRLAQRGMRVVLGARRAERLEALANELGPHCSGIRTDVARLEDVEALAAHAIGRHGGIDVWINNAGVMPVAALEDGRVEDWQRAIDVNLRGVLHGVQATLRHMLARGRGHIVNVGSFAAHRVLPTMAVYGATKAAVQALTEGLRQEVAGRVRVTLVSPGAVRTELPEGVHDARRREEMREFFARYALAPATIADAIVYALEQPPEVAVSEIVVRPQGGMIR